MIERLGAALPHRPVAEARLAEPAASNAAAEDLQVCPVVDDLRIGDDRLRRIVRLVQIPHNALDHPLRRAVQGFNGLEPSIRAIVMAVKRRHIDAGNLHHFMEKARLVPPFALGLAVEVENLRRHLLPFSQREKVDKVRQRFRVHSADAAGKHQPLQTRAIPAQKRHPGQVQHIENIGIAHLIADAEGDKVEVLHRVAALQGIERNLVLAHGRLHVPPGRKDSLAPHAVHVVHDAIENAHADVGHADFIGVREAEGNP